MLKCIKMGYYVLEFFIGVGNRDIMTKELSFIRLFFVLFCLFLPVKLGVFCLGMF
jgi:hypothetical protein